MVNGMISDSRSPQNLSIIIQTKNPTSVGPFAKWILFIVKISLYWNLIAKNPTVGGVFYYLSKLIRDLLFGSVHQELRMPCMKRLQN